jgi:hypothetical protein
MHFLAWMGLYMTIRDAAARFQVMHQCHLVSSSVTGSRDQTMFVELYTLLSNICQYIGMVVTVSGFGCLGMMKGARA